MKLLVLFSVILLIFLIPFSCQTASSPQQEEAIRELQDTSKSIPRDIPGEVVATLDTLGNQPPPPLGALEQKLIDAGLVDIQSIDPSIQVELKYATTDNFLKENVYGELTRCYLQPSVANKLVKAQEILQKGHPNLSLLVYDGVRPRSVQYKMWEIVKGTEQQKYVASPHSGSMHNYGASVDLTLAREDGTPLDMGTPFDFFGPLAQPRYEQQYLESGELSQQQLDNRRTLRAAMLAAGFHGILSEWWHFNAFPRDTFKQRFQRVE
jgi:D-alanyl-D-alanine dipeptidase